MSKSSPISWVRIAGALVFLSLLFTVGFCMGRLFPAPTGTIHSALTPVTRPFRNLARMLAMSGSSDEGLGMGRDAFPDTLDSYWKSLGIISSQFYNPTPLELFTAAGQTVLKNRAKLRTQLTYSAIQGVMSSLNDPYTRFMDPSAFKEMQQDNSGSFAGIGAQLIDKDGKIVIAKPLPGTPAEEAHIMPMDEIVSINGRSTSKMLSQTAVDLIRGKPGTIVTLGLRRGKQLITLHLVRAVINSQHFEYNMMSGGIGYMHLMMFDEQASDNVVRAMASFRQEHARGVILDLRDNPGGLLDEAVKVSSSLIPPGVVVWVQERGGQRSALKTDSHISTKGSLPLVVLVNHFSASASEIVSGAVKDTHSGTLVGLTTWGKGLVQEVIPLNDHSALALTTAHYFTPGGSDINLKGVTPDVVVGHNLPEPESDSAADVTRLIKERDAMDQLQLDTAVQLLRKQMTQLSAQR